MVGLWNGLEEEKKTAEKYVGIWEYVLPQFYTFRIGF